MKLIFAILAILLSAKECDQKKMDKESAKSELMDNQEVTRQQQEKDYIIRYSAVSRGFFSEVAINSSMISVKKNRNAEAEIKSCDSELWRELTSKIDSIDLEMIPKLEAPTQKRFSDAAAIANLEISIGDETYKTTSFDHGYPPKEIEEICNSIVELLQD